MTFKTFIENRRKLLTSSESERRLSLIETEAMSIAHRELVNARHVAESFFPRDSLCMDDLLKVQGMLAGLYGLAYRELIIRGEIEVPVAPAVPPNEKPVSGGN